MLTLGRFFDLVQWDNLCNCYFLILMRSFLGASENVSKNARFCQNAQFWDPARMKKYAFGDVGMK